MREAGRTALLVVLPGALIAFGWARIEHPSMPAWTAAWMAVLGLAPAVLPRLWMRLAGGLVGLALAVHTALRVSVLDARPFDHSHSFFGPLASHFGTGLGNYYDYSLPFNRHNLVYMHGVALLAIFAGCFCVGLCVAARRPALSALMLLVWAAWPMTLLTGPGDLKRGAFVLAGVLLLLSAVRPAPGRRVGLGLGLAGLLVLGSLAVSTSPAVAKGEFLNWQNWDLYTRPDTPVGVSYIWDMRFGGITFPKKVTTVFRVQGPKTPHYWRATTLDLFTNDSWYEGDLGSVVPDIVGKRAVLTSDAYLPAAARNKKNWLEERVTMAALRDDHLVGAAQPVAYDLRDVPSARYERSGVARANEELHRDQSYTVWSYAPQPTPKQLQAAKPDYPPDIARYTDLATGLETSSSASSYDPVFAAARRVTAGAGNEYDATVALEAWFRSNPAFTYDQHPHVTPGMLPLVWFVTVGRKGYCQYYAGAMALMLRSLGIPARVAAGFTAGKYDAKTHTWTVTDHQAHTWVEVWFKGYGWLPFDPTPSRGGLGGTYSTASPAFDAVAAGLFAVAKRLGLSGFDVKRRNDFGFDPKGTLSGLQADVPRKGGGGVTQVLTDSSRNASLLRLLLLVAAVALALVIATKAAVRHGRYLTRDPRRVAAACRREVADFLTDQRIAVSRSATPHELSALVRTELGVDGAPLADAVASARFGPPSGARESAQRARRERRRILRSMRRALPIRRRTRGLLSLRSLGVTR